VGLPGKSILQRLTCSDIHCFGKRKIVGATPAIIQNNFTGQLDGFVKPLPSMAGEACPFFHPFQGVFFCSKPPAKKEIGVNVVMRKTFCSCGHYEYQCAVKKFGQKTYCKSCWKSYRETGGQTITGCIFPEVAVCPDREPACLNMKFSLEDRLKLLEKAKCYRGHARCVYQKHHINNVINIAEKIFNGEQVPCPHKGCNQNLSVVRSNYVLISVCPLHGVISRLVINQEEKD